MTDSFDSGRDGSVWWTHVQAARQALAAVLVGAGEDDLDTVLLVGEALSVLNEAVPPFPPLEYPQQATPVAVGITQALTALAKAGAAAETADDAARFAQSVRLLRGHRLVAE